MSHTFSTFVAMKNALKLKRLMMSYLNTHAHPEIYLLELNHLGDIVQTFDERKKDCWLDIRKVNRSKDSWFDMRKEVIDLLVLLFSVTHTYAESVLNDWVNCRPKYKWVRKSMDEQVLEPVMFVAEDICGKEEWILSPVTRETHMSM
jgi:hypothetical protein